MWLKEALIPANVVSMTNVIYALRQEEESKKQICPDIFTELQKIAKVQSVKASNAIEGIVTTDKRIEAIVNQNNAPLDHNEQEIAGYRDALDVVHTQYENIPFNEETILNLHRIMLDQTNYSLKGEYKKEDNIILEKYADGTSRVRFAPIKAKETKEAIDQMILAYTEARDDNDVSDLFLIPCVVLDFLCIHPFQDGNGRIGRLIMFKECLAAGIVPFIITEELKMYYYRGLREWPRVQGFLLDTCLTAQDNFKALLDYFKIKYRP